MAQDPAQTSLIGDQATAPATQAAAGPAAPAPAEPTAAAASDPGPGAMVGPWQLRRLLGRGGMGAVYLAERARQDFQQRAALKLIKLGMDSGEIQRRFLSERRILARLEHPQAYRGDPKIVWSVGVWLLYLGLIIWRWRFAQGGRRFALGVLGSFLFVLLTFWGTNVLSPLHNP